MLIKYFEIEDDYADDPSNVDFDELYIYLENDHKKFQEEISKLVEDQIIHEQSLDSEFQEKALDFILNKKLDGFINNYILEFTPLGNVYMRYNHFKNSFEYFSNNTIPYRYLETIGRKYVMTFRCKQLFIDLEDELKKASVLALEKEKEKEALEKVTTNPVQKFKSYNKDIKMDNLYAKGRPGQHKLPPQIKANLPNVNTTNGEKQVLKENANRYTWEGRLSSMQLLKKVNRKIIDKNYAMTFSDFKQIKK
jgi:DNA-binding protein H-NS